MARSAPPIQRGSSGDENEMPRFRTQPPSPVTTRSYTSLRSPVPRRGDMEDEIDEETPLVISSVGPRRRHIKSSPDTPVSRALSRQHSTIGSLYGPQLQNRTQSWPLRMNSGPGTAAQEEWRPSMDNRVWYDQFTSTDWVHDSIADGYRVRRLQQRKDFRGRVTYLFDKAQGWLLVGIIGCITAFIAYFVDITESAIYDIKEGVCVTGWHYSRRHCPQEDWRRWSTLLRSSGEESTFIDFAAFVGACILLAALSCYLTLLSKTVVPSHIASTLDENLGAARYSAATDDVKDTASVPVEDTQSPTITYYAVAGSGVAEVRVILSGFVLHGYLGLKVLALKTLALVLSVASGMSLGKEGPYVHMATAVGNICCRPFTKYSMNDGKRREILSAAAASGVAVAFGAPIGGVLFSLEEVSYYFPSKTLFRTFFCCITAALTLKMLDPYGTGNIVIFEVRYVTNWRFFELFNFAFLGVAGGLLGALFIKASRFWATTFRRLPFIKASPMAEVILVALITGLMGFWNRYTKLAVTELLFELAAPCDKHAETGLCPKPEDIPQVIRCLLIAFVIKAVLTVVTFGIKVPAGIYVPSMILGGLMGRMFGHSLQWLVIKYPSTLLFSDCPEGGGGIESCFVPGMYALVAAGATMCGVTRLSITLAVILFELTSSLDHVLPFALGIMFAKWTADAVEPLSIYDLLTDMNSYPFLDSSKGYVFDGELSDIATRTRRTRLIDISLSPLIPATELREKLTTIQAVGELDGGLPIVRYDILIGVAPAIDLDFALDRIDDESSAMCLMVDFEQHQNWSGHFNQDSAASGDEEGAEPIDLQPYIDRSPIALDIHAPLDLVYQCFVKLGLRYVCVVKEGKFHSLLHKKTFVRYVKDMEEEKRV